LAAIKTRVDRVGAKVDEVDHTLKDLIKNLPRMIGQSMREVLRERDRKK
jgi:hypothetical protein